ncbi:hypothetical protein GCM10027445_65250 [Amycolatopsis endophytica]|uniref:Uncharacterized protein n=1 Tax=Amycolatopsis endophytica TaxID=860233 RepID=A0A853AZE2_9PSEU|nr:hypothetical protein [Amycolatopsis endophytica]NYI87995.1 hypothetical protein [Amycolatopsis endophytica]
MTISLRAHTSLSVLVGAPLVWEISRVDLAWESLPFLLCCGFTAAAPWLALRFGWWTGVLPAAVGVLGSAGFVLWLDHLPARPEVANLPAVQIAGVLAVLVIVVRDAGPWGAWLGGVVLASSTAAAATAIQLWTRAPHYAPTVAGTALLLFGGALASGVYLRSGYSAASRWTTGSTSAARMDLR